MRKWLRVFWYCILRDRHVNAYDEEWPTPSLYPVVCNDCKQFYYPLTQSRSRTPATETSNV